jgi:hypothetical protein
MKDNETRTVDQSCMSWIADGRPGRSNLTWQIASGLGYQTGWAGASLTYRYLSFERGSGAVAKHLSMDGPILTVNLTV